MKPAGPHPRDWPPEREARLLVLWLDDNWSASRIAKALKVSKNAVVGKAHRLGLVPKPRKMTYAEIEAAELAARQAAQRARIEAARKEADAALELARAGGRALDVCRIPGCCGTRLKPWPYCYWHRPKPARKQREEAA